MPFYYRNMYVGAKSNVIFYKGQGFAGPCWINVTHYFDKFKKSGVVPTKEDLDIFIFEYELETGLKPYG